MEHRKYYKKLSISLADRARERRSQRINKAREENRLNILNSRRNIQDIEIHAPTVPVSKTSQRAAMLAKWKAEKQKTLAEQKKNQKPVFKVGILQRKATGSPLLKLTSSYAGKNFLKPDQVSKVIRPSNTGIVTRAKAKALAIGNQEEPKKDSKFSIIVNNKRKAIKNHVFSVPESVTAFSNQLKITLPQTPKVLKGKRNMKVRINDSVKVHEKTIEKSVWNAEEHCKETTGMEKCIEEVENESAIVKDVQETVKDDTKTNNGSTDFVPIHYSPFVKSERGSDRKVSRREKLKLTTDIDELIEKEENEFKCRIFSFRKYVECQTKKLLDLCHLWKEMTTTDQTIPTDVQDEILSLCGKTNLLTSDKFKQFKDLIDKCENRDPMIKIEDLQGYQDWVAIEVEGLDQAFIELEERKERGWKCEIRVGIKVQKENRPVRTKRTGRFQGVRSNIREHILAAKKKIQKNQDGADGTEKIQMELRTPVKTPKKENRLLKEVLGSETKKLNSPVLKTRNLCNNLRSSATKRRASGMEIMAATQLAKTLTPGKSCKQNIFDEQTTSINEIITPLRSILKLTPSSHSTPKHSVQFKLNKSNKKTSGLNEKYFEPLMDVSENSIYD